MRVLEGKAAVSKRRTLGGLIELCESGKLGMADLTDEELEWIIVGLPGDTVDVGHLSDDELNAIING